MFIINLTYKTELNKIDNHINNHIEFLNEQYEVLKSKINGSEMNEIGIYPEIWTESESYEFLIDSFQEFKAFYQKASKNNEAIITYLN